MPDDIEPKPRPKPVRPPYLVVALVLAWILGVGGVMSGCGTLQFFRETTHDAIELDAKMDPMLRKSVEAQHQARAEALDASHGRMIPLAVANVLLSGLLIVACARALSIRPRSHLLVLQAIAANLVYAIVDYFVSAPVRGAIIAAGTAHPPGDMNGVDAAQLTAVYEWLFRFALVGEVLALSIAAYVMTRPHVMALFQSDPDDQET